MLHNALWNDRGRNSRNQYCSHKIPWPAILTTDKRELKSLMQIGWKILQTQKEIKTHQGATLSTRQISTINSSYLCEYVFGKSPLRRCIPFVCGRSIMWITSCYAVMARHSQMLHPSTIQLITHQYHQIICKPVKLDKLH